jgi:hypothetical protein
MIDDRLNRLDSYLEVIDTEVRTSRRASEIFFDMPSLSVAVEGERLIRDDLDETYANFVKPVEVGLENKRSGIVDIKDVYWQEASRVPEISGTYQDAMLEDYFRVDVDRSEVAIRDAIRENYEPNSPAHLLLKGIEKYAEAFGISIMEAARIATKHIQLQLPFLKLRAQEIMGLEDISQVDATSRVFEEFVDILIPAHIKIQEESPDRDYLHGFVNKIPSSEVDLLDLAPALRLNAHDATGLTKVYKLERRPYTKDELELANELASDPLIQASLINFQMAIVDYSKKYLEEHPERAKHSLLPFSEFFVKIDDVLCPNPKLIKVLCNNYLPAVSGIMIRKGITSVENLTDDILGEAAVDARKRRVFFAQIGKFNNLDPDTNTVELDSFVSRTCPGMQTLTNGLSMWMPRIFRELKDAA